MGKQVMKGLRLPGAIVERIEQVADDEQSTFSQFVRTAVVHELQRKERGVAPVREAHNRQTKRKRGA